MTTAFTTQNLQNVFAIPLRDPDWLKKLTIAGLLMLASYFIPILPLLILAGWVHQIMRQVILTGTIERLPEWNDLGRLLSEGVKIGGALFIYMAPFVLFTVFGYFIMLAPAFLGPIVDAARPPEQGFFITLMMGLMLLGTFVFIIGLFLAIAATAVLPAGIAHVAAQDDFGAAFRFREWWPIFRANWGGFVLIFVLLMGIGYILYFFLGVLMITIILCLVIPIFLSAALAYLVPVSSILYGQAYRDGVEKRGQALLPEAVQERPGTE
jgi:hypothetical protein